MKYYLYGIVVGLVALIGACSREPMEPQTGSLAVHFDNVVGNQNLQLNDQTYTNAAGEPFTVSRLDYFVSNIRLRRADGSEFVVPQDSSYFLVRESDASSQTLRLNKIPVGQYTGMSFLIGVDSLRSVAGVEQRKGILDPANPATAGMTWDWNTGYIFLKLEGTSPAAPANATGQRSYVFHIGLYGRNGTPNNLRTVSLAFGGQTAQPSTSAAPTVQVQADVQKVFDGAKRMSLAQKSTIMIAPESADVATNYATMFSFVGVSPSER
jgi:hypothetical protein